jgi:hypothetical protein
MCIETEMENITSKNAKQHFQHGENDKKNRILENNQTIADSQIM